MVVGEFTQTKHPDKAPVEIGRSRLLDAYAAENKKRRKNAMGVLTFGTEGDGGNV